jgi:hypothetical protein
VVGEQEERLALVLLKEYGFEVQIQIQDLWRPGDSFDVHCTEVNPAAAQFTLCEVPSPWERPESSGYVGPPADPIPLRHISVYGDLPTIVDAPLAPYL